MAEFCCKKQGGLDEATALKTFSNFQDDFEFLIMKLETLETTLSTAREQINEQMSLTRVSIKVLPGCSLKYRYCL